MADISVIIPSYNAAPYLPQALQSVLDQGWDSLEIILVDDGSTDNTKEIASCYGSRVCYIETSNAGPAAARNLGISRANGKYLAFLDADDAWLPGKLQRQLDLLSQCPDCSFVCSDWYNGRDCSESRTSVLSGYGAWIQNANFDLMLRENFVNTSTVLVERQKIVEVGLFPERLRGAEDRYLWLRLLTLGEAAICREILAFRRFHAGNTTATLPFVRSQVQMLQELLQWPEVASNSARLATTQTRYRETRQSLAYALSREGNYLESARIYRDLCREPGAFSRSAIRYVWFSLLGTFVAAVGEGDR